MLKSARGLYALVAIIVAGALLGLATKLQAQGSVQQADPDYAPSIKAASQIGEGPVIAIDQAHANFHQLGGRYAPFARLARHGGYRVIASKTAFTGESLVDIDILVIANARTAAMGGGITELEADAVAEWVAAGGSLFLLADHAPFSAGAAPLGARFGVDMGDGYVVTGRRAKASGTIDYRAANAPPHPIFTGAAPGRRVKSVRLFMGQSLGIPEGAAVLLRLPSRSVSLPDRPAIAAYRAGQGEGTDVAGRAQALAIAHGKGRVVISAEAGMFTAQVVTTKGRSPRYFGVNNLDNEAYALNILDWLSGRLN